jgi:hypothetical protein
MNYGRSTFDPWLHAHSEAASDCLFVTHTDCVLNGGDRKIQESGHGVAKTSWEFCSTQKFVNPPLFRRKGGYPRFCPSRRGHQPCLRHFRLKLNTP